MKVAIGFLFFVVLTLTTTVAAQKVYDKPYTKWSRGEVEKILTTSAWVRSYQSAEANAAIDKEAMLKNQDNLRITPGARASDANAQSATLAATPITVRLQSASVIRQATVRLEQLSANYDKLDDGKKAAFDASAKDLIDCPFCKNYYIVTMSKSVDSSNRSVEDGLFQTMTAADMKGKVSIILDSGMKLPLMQFMPPKGARDSAVLFFPRRNGKGEELITPEIKSFRIEFDGSFFSSSNPYAKMIPTSFEFEVKDLILGEKVVF